MFQTPPASPRQILTVTRLNRLARTLLESEMGLIWLSAEVSNFVAAASGHWYFTLKDNKAQVRAAMFKNANRLVRRRPKEGDKILVRASVGIYEARGDYQLIVEHLEDDGEGRLKQAFDALKAKLLGEGLFDASKKRPLPDSIQRIGVITSASGAALHDVLSVLGRRSPATQVVVYPSLVQGESAAAQLIDAIHTANARNEVDVILLTRGGGSMEDLWCFNNEALARTIASSDLPIVSAVGHEVDITIADFVADLRAPTPSAAAEQLSQDTRALLQRLDTLTTRLSRTMEARIRNAERQLKASHQHLRALHPANQINAQNQNLRRLSRSLQHGMLQHLRYARQQARNLDERLHRVSPLKSLHASQHQLDGLTRRLVAAMTQRQRSAEQALATQAQLLQSVSPLATLARGYSITFSGTTAVTGVNQVNEGDSLTTRVADGEIVSTVSATKQLNDE
ncbi:exodeoxyribonuclease VII large subunit [Alteromonas halophila]|uniref:Exodeoxyribonuclease 7 large subunit n=1 Tax=Alteromonas halophila TaxID=516698 RepID=A0A918MYK2_9ALTE|nr:exodeoxyribonuclease VII large subunit [Alteromonas halophila]GGW86415.1 exodeoxyribonuclease 7 large subunit [Alteromonas halophila]